jgi:hypothetical protein
MFKPAFQGQEDPRIGQLDELMGQILLKLRVMQRASAADKGRYRAEVRELLVKLAEKTMGLADAFQR